MSPNELGHAVEGLDRLCRAVLGDDDVDAQDRLYAALGSVSVLLTEPAPSLLLQGSLRQLEVHVEIVRARIEARRATDRFTASSLRASVQALRHVLAGIRDAIAEAGIPGAG